MPLYSGRYTRLLEEERDPERLVRRFLALLEADLRETALLGLSAWHRAGIPKERWQPALPNLFRAIAGLQKPAFGHWNGLLYALREALRSAHPESALPADPARLEALESILAWLREPTDPPVTAALRGMAGPLNFSLPGAPSRWHAIGLTVYLRNRIAHEHPADDWWASIAPGVGRLASGLAALPPCLDPTRLVYPAPWFLRREGMTYAFGGFQGDEVVYAAPGLSPVRLPAADTEIIRAFQHALGQAEVQQATFREMLTRLAPEEIKGVLLGDFLLGPPVARGGFADVHRGYQLSTQRKVALKVFPDGLTESKRALLRKEAANLGAFNAPEIVRLIGLYENVPWVAPADISLSAEFWFQALKKSSPFKTFLAMEWVDGEKLDDVFRRPAEQAPPIGVLVEWFATAAEALAKVHAQPGGLVHRDVTPNNLMVTPEAQIKLMDFGIASGGAERRDLMTRTRSAAGTPAYMAPEQLDDAWSDRSDVYSLCATFYELFARRRLYDHDRSTIAEVNRKKREGCPPDPPRRCHARVPWEIDVLLLGGLCKEAELRPSSRDLADDLLRVRANQPIRFRRPPLRRRADLWYRRNRTAVRVAVAAGVILACISTVLGSLWLKEQGRSSRMEQQVGGLTKQVGASERLAEEKGRLAIARGKQADLAEKQKRLEEYVGDMQRIPNLWRADAVAEVRRILRRYDPSAGQEDLRGYEWWYWDARSDASARAWNAGARVVSLDWSPDGRTLYTVDATGRLDAWDVETGGRRRLGKADSRYTVVASEPNGRRIAAISVEAKAGGGSPSTVDWIDPAGGQPIGAIPCRIFPFTAVAVSPDGHGLVAATAMAELLACDLEPIEARMDLANNRNSRRNVPINPMQILDRHEGRVRAVAYSPDGSTVVTGAQDGTIARWDPRNGRCLGWLVTEPDSGRLAHRGEVASLTFSRDGTKLLSRGLPRGRETFRPASAPGELVLWDALRGDFLWRIEFPGEPEPVIGAGPGLDPRGAGNYRADFVLDDRRAAVGEGPIVRLYDVETRAPAGELKGHAARVVCLRASPDGLTLATSDESGEVRLWNLAATTKGEVIVDRFESPARGLAAAPAAERFAALRDAGVGLRSSGAEDAADEKVALLYVPPDAARPRGESSPVPPSSASHPPSPVGWVYRPLDEKAGLYTGLSFSPSGRLLAAVDPLRKEKVRVWDAETGRVVRVFEGMGQALGSGTGDRPGRSRRISPRWAAFRTEDEIDVVSGSPLLRLHLGTGGVEPAGAGPAGEVGHPDPRIPMPPTSVMRLAFSADGRRAAAGTAGGDIVVYDAGTWQPVASLRLHSRGVTGLAFSADGRRLVSCSGRYFYGNEVDPDERPGEIIVWDTLTWKPCLTLVRDEPSEYSGVGLSPDGRTLYAAANPVEPGTGRQPRGVVVRWGRSASTPAPAERTAAAPPRPLAGTSLTSGNLTLTGPEPAVLLSVAIHPAGNLVAAYSSGGYLLLWDARARTKLRQVPLHRNSMGDGWRLRFSQDGTRLVCLDLYGRRASIRATATLAEEATEIPPGRSRIFDAFAPRDGKPIRTIESTQEGGMVVRPGAGKDLVLQASGGPGSAYSGGARFSPDGRRIALLAATPADAPGPARKARIVLASADSGAVEMDQPLDGNPYRFDFTPDGATLFASVLDDPGNAKSRTSTLHRWDVKTGKAADPVRGVGTVLAVTDDPARCLETVDGGVIARRDLADASHPPVPVAVEPRLRGVELFPDGQHFATFGNQEGVSIASLSQPLERDEGVLLHTARIGRLMVASGGRKLVSLGAGGAVVHDLETGADAWINTPPGVDRLEFMASADLGRLVGVQRASRGQDFRVIRIEDGSEEPLDPAPGDLPGPAGAAGERTAGPVTLEAAASAADGRLLYLLGRNAGPLPGGMGRGPAGSSWILRDGRASREINGLETCAAAAFSPAGALVAVLARERKAPMPGTAPEPAPRAKATRAPAKNRPATPRRPVVNPQADHILFVLAVTDGSVISRVPIGYVGDVRSLGFSADGSRIELNWQSRGERAGPPSYSFLAIDPKTGREIVRRAGLKWGPIALSPDGRLLARGDAGAVVVEDFARNSQAARFELRAGLVGLAFSPDGRWLYTSGLDYAIRRWTIPQAGR